MHWRRDAPSQGLVQLIIRKIVVPTASNRFQLIALHWCLAREGHFGWLSRVADVGLLLCMTRTWKESSLIKIYHFSRSVVSESTPRRGSLALTLSGTRTGRQA